MPQTKRQRGATYSDDESVNLSSSDKENSANRRQRKSKKRAKDSSPTQADTSSTQLLPSTQKGHGKAFYDPEQSVDDRRKVRRELRAFQRTVTGMKWARVTRSQIWPNTSVPDNKKKHAKGDFKLLQGSFCTSNKLFTGVKQTSDATIDSGALVMLADDSLTSMQRMDLADGAAVGIDLDDFALQVMKFMRKGPNPPEQNRGNVDWAYLGRKVAQGVHKRPPSTPFMYGPIAIKKKVRQVHARRERLRYDEKDKVAPITLKDDEIKAAEQTTPLLVQDCYKALEDYMVDHPEDEVRGIDVFRFIINPHSFGQSVENLFYLSFLVRDGRSAILDREGGSGLATSKSSCEFIARTL